MGATATTQELPRHCILDELIKNYYKLVINRLRWSKTKRRRMRMEGVDTNECKGVFQCSFLFLSSTSVFQLGSGSGQKNFKYPKKAKPQNVNGHAKFHVHDCLNYTK
jgi:hypothetical protein